MRAPHRQILASAVFVLDGAIIALSWLGSYWLRFHALGIPAPLGVPPLSLYLWFGAVLTPFALGETTRRSLAHDPAHPFTQPGRNQTPQRTGHG